jgi:hypothetical protein
LIADILILPIPGASVISTRRAPGSEAKQYAKEMLSDSHKIMAGTLQANRS